MGITLGFVLILRTPGPSERKESAPFTDAIRGVLDVRRFKGNEDCGVREESISAASLSGGVIGEGRGFSF